MFDGKRSPKLMLKTTFPVSVLLVESYTSQFRGAFDQDSYLQSYKVVFKETSFFYSHWFSCRTGANKQNQRVIFMAPARSGIYACIVGQLR